MTNDTSFNTKSNPPSSIMEPIDETPSLISTVSVEYLSVIRLRQVQSHAELSLRATKSIVFKYAEYYYVSILILIH